MNDFRLSTYNGDKDREAITQEEITKIKTAPPLFLVLPDGRVKGIVSGNIEHQYESSVYQIIKVEFANVNEKEILVESLKEAADIIGVHYNTLSKQLGSAAAGEFSSSSIGARNSKVNNYLIRRIKIFGC